LTFIYIKKGTSDPPSEDDPLHNCFQFLQILAKATRFTRTVCGFIYHIEFCDALILFLT